MRELTTAAWARESLDRVDSYLNVHAAEMTQLRDSGVSESRVQSLYPFCIEDYYGGLKWLLPAGKTTQHLLTTFAFSSTFHTVGPFLDQANYELALSVSQQSLSDYPELEGLQQTRLIFQNILQVPIILRYLALDRPLDMAGEVSVQKNFELFKNIVEEFIDYLAKKAALEASI